MTSKSQRQHKLYPDTAVTTSKTQGTEEDCPNIPKWSTFEICRTDFFRHGALRAIIAGAAIGRAATTAIHRSAADAAEIPGQELPQFPAPRGPESADGGDADGGDARGDAPTTTKSRSKDGAKSLDSVDHPQVQDSNTPGI